MELRNEIQQIEQALVGCFIHHPHLFKIRSLEAKPALFAGDEQIVLIEAMHELDEHEQPFDVLMVKQKIRSKGYTNEFVQYIDLLPKEELSEPLLDSYITALGQDCERRIFANLGQQLISESADITKPVHGLYEQTETTLQQLNQLLRNKDVKPLKQVLKGFMTNVGPTLGRVVDWLDPVLNRNMNGMGKGELIIMGARPGMGKTSFMISQTLYTAMVQQKGVAFVSYELSAEQLMKRMLINYTGLPGTLLKPGSSLTEEQEKKLLDGINTLSNLPIHIIDNSGLGLFELRNTLRKLKTAHNIELVCVDYVQLIPTYRKMHIREQEISLISRVLKQIARELEISIFVSSQLSRASEKRGVSAIPMLSDLREGGSLEQDADKVLFLYRPEYYHISEFEDGSSTNGVAEVHIAKNRTGSLDCVRMLFQHHSSAFISVPFNYKPPESDDFSLPPDLDALFGGPPF